MSLKIKSCSYPVESALLKSLVPSEAKPLLYKKKSFDGRRMSRFDTPKKNLGLCKLE